MVIKGLQNVGVGFVMSFVGSVPLGYLNLAGYEMLRREGVEAFWQYVVGVVCVEVFVIYFTLVFAGKLLERKRLIKYIELFSIAFMLTLAVLFFVKSDDKSDAFFLRYFNHAPLVTGVLLSAMNFMQLPFWTGWNLYLVNKHWIYTHGWLKLPYVAGTLLGTAAGIALIAMGLDQAGRSAAFSQSIMPFLFPAVFLLLALWQGVQYVRKHGFKI